jgi:hypothetical protein
MIRVLVSYLKFHYGRAYIEGFNVLKSDILALGFIGIPLAIVWTLLPFIIASFIISGLYFVFIWNAL